MQVKGRAAVLVNGHCIQRDQLSLPDSTSSNLEKASDCQARRQEASAISLVLGNLSSGILSLRVCQSQLAGSSISSLSVGDKASC